MSEAGNVPLTGVSANQKPFTELRVTAHLMTLEPGLFCIVQTPAVRRPEDASGLPGVRISLPPSPGARAQSVAITSFRPDGYLNGAADAALVRVTDGPAQILVTIYQAAAGTDTAPRLQVLRLADDGVPGRAAAGTALPASAAPAGGAAAAGPGQQTLLPDVVAHVQLRGDIGAGLGEWIGDRGSKRWVEGFAIAPQSGPVSPKDIEYQAVLGRGWLSPWVEGGQLCGSRGMALPILGLRLRLRGEAAERFDCEYSATFTDGSAVGPMPAGESCEAESLAPIEAFQVVVRPRAKAGATTARATRGGAAAKPELAEVAAGPAKPEPRKSAARSKPEPVAAADGPKRGGSAAGRRPRP
jgi:hypothetical protein